MSDKCAVVCSRIIDKKGGSCEQPIITQFGQNPGPLAVAMLLEKHLWKSFVYALMLMDGKYIRKSEPP